VLERRVETARQLEAPRLELRYEKVPLAEVLADLSKRSGNPVKLASDADEVAKRPITLAGDWTFWEALAHICSAADLSEPEPGVVQTPALQIEEGGFRARGARRVLYLETLRSGRSAQELEPITLTSARTTPRPTFQAGALRVRMFGPLASCPVDAGGDRKYAPLTLEVKPEPRIGWERLAAVRLERVIDEKGRELPVPASVYGDTALLDLDESVVIIWDGHYDLPLAPAPQRFAFQFEVRDGSTASLREIQGSVSGWIRTAPEPLITLDNLPKAVNETHTSIDGCRLKVVQCHRAEDGLYQVQIELTPPENPQVTDLFNRHIVRLNRRFIDKETTSLDTSSSLPFVLTGAQGEKLGLVTGTLEHDAAGPSRVYSLVYKPDKDGMGPVKLVYRDRRSAFVEIPFTLRDIPLYTRETKR
jgi:hypothetical protein